MATKPIPKQHLKRLNALSTYLHELRINENLSQMEVMAETGIHRNTISNIEHTHNFTVLVLLELADIYGVSPSELLSIME